MPMVQSSGSSLCGSVSMCIGYFKEQLHFGVCSHTGSAKIPLPFPHSLGCNVGVPGEEGEEIRAVPRASDILPHCLVSLLLWVTCKPIRQPLTSVIMCRLPWARHFSGCLLQCMQCSTCPGVTVGTLADHMQGFVDSKSFYEGIVDYSYIGHVFVMKFLLNASTIDLVTLIIASFPASPVQIIKWA